MIRAALSPNSNNQPTNRVVTTLRKCAAIVEFSELARSVGEAFLDSHVPELLLNFQALVNLFFGDEPFLKGYLTKEKFRNRHSKHSNSIPPSPTWKALE